jgi:multidrug transporter EmrE-like cation transporter
VICCTLSGAAAQIFMKSGAHNLSQPGLMGFVTDTLTNPPLLTGYFLLGVNTVLLSLALRDAELSLVYPIIALTYVWVALLAYFIFHDRVSPLRVVGILAIVVGVAVLGMEKRR